MKITENLINWKFHLGEIKLWEKLTHDACYNATKAGRMLGKNLYYIEGNEWTDITVPHDFCITQKADPELGSESNGYKPRVCGWYYTKFDMPERADGEVWLEFEGVGSRCDVYVNGILATRNFSGYTGFMCEISDSLVKEGNIITVRADNYRLEGWWYEGAGIYRPVKLHFTSGGYIKPLETHIKQTLINGGWQVDVSCEACGADKYEIRSYLYGGDELIASGSPSFNLIDPRLWSPDAPYLYTLKLELTVNGEVADSEIHKIGFRTVEWRTDGGMFINGERTFVKGICCHQDHGGVGLAVPELLIRYRLEKLKKTGCNAYRCAHHNVSSEFLSICDELGILVMNENRSFNSSEETLEEIRYMVKNSRNHPSVFLYSLFNEEPLQKEIRGKRIAAKLKNAILELDTDRAITGAINGAEVINGESAADVLDVMGMNYSIFAYEKLYKAQGKVILGTENGPVYATRGVYKADREKQVYGNYGDDLTAFGQSYEATLKAAKEHDYIAGVFLWSGFEYHGEPQPFTWPSVLSHWGMCDICGFEKDIYYYVKSFYTDEPMIHLLPAWQDYAEGEIVRVCAFTNCGSVKLYLNGESVGEAVVSDNKAEFNIPFKAGTLRAEGYANGKTVCDAVSTPGEGRTLDIDVTTDGRFRIIDVTAVDEKGCPVNSADYPITLNACGGRIIGSSNGDPNSPIDCTADTVKLFHGKCQFIVDRTEDDLRISISSPIGVFNV